ncbi:pumilio homolog 3 [Trichonephila clavata]|uniref:Pumilio homolog 3 n=1 Tax=Trichonephila clavata TaxID=2740835 RepID=A0A8X6LSZ3_TRICU|nr:pumilio homolog 3 [Trichonephila clavata]
MGHSCGISILCKEWGMNPIEKPKGVKLWKKQKTHKQNTDNLKMKVKSDKSDEMDFSESVPKLKPSKKKPKKRVQNNIEIEDTNNVSPKKTNGEAKESDSSNTAGDKKLKSILKKRKNEFQDSNSKKKMKPNVLPGKQREKLHFDKKSKSKDSNLNTDTSAETKKKAEKGKLTKKEFKKRKMEKKGKSKTFEVAQNLIKLWEDLRREDNKPEKKNQLLKQACDLLKGRVKEFTFAHDTVRVLECILREGAETHRNLLFDELKNDIFPLSKSKYGKFFVLKLLKYGTKEQKVAVMKAFHGKVVQLIRHTEASEVVELAFNECANAAQRFEFVQEFFNPTYKFFKTHDVSSLEELFEKEPSKKSSIITHMKDELLKILDKSVIKHSMVHNVLWQFMRHADPESRAEVIQSVRDVVHEILHTKDGSRVGKHCVWHGTVKACENSVMFYIQFINLIFLPIPVIFLEGIIKGQHNKYCAKYLSNFLLNRFIL